ncbi:uncharacterized protein J5M81_002024 [Pluvialis apricaria]
MGQANCCCGSRWALPGARGHAGTAGPRSSSLSHARRSLLCREALSEAEAVLSADVRLTRGRKRSERRLLLLQQELVMAKLQRGTTLRPRLRLALDQLWVLSAGTEAALEEQEGSHEDGSSIILSWPSGSCVATFGSRALKELWVGTLLGTPEGAKRARVTQLPSIKHLEKELSRRHAWRTFSARSLERLLEGQAKDDPKGGPPLAASVNEGGLHRSSELRMLLPFALRKLVPITLRQERAEPSGPFNSAERSRCCLPQLHAQSRVDGSPLLERSQEELFSLVP